MFNNGTYRGVGAVYAACGGSNIVVSIAIERIGSNQWMLLNVFATTLAGVEAAGRILQTVDFLNPTPNRVPPAAATKQSPPDTTVVPVPAGSAGRVGWCLRWGCPKSIGI